MEGQRRSPLRFQIVVESCECESAGLIQAGAMQDKKARRVRSPQRLTCALGNEQARFEKVWRSGNAGDVEEPIVRPFAKLFGFPNARRPKVRPARPGPGSLPAVSMVAEPVVSARPLLSPSKNPSQRPSIIADEQENSSSDNRHSSASP